MWCENFTGEDHVTYRKLNDNFIKLKLYDVMKNWGNLVVLSRKFAITHQKYQY